MKWHNEHPVWNIQNGTISITSGQRTDFWRKTHYGFIRDDGHFYYEQVKGDFIVEVKVSGQYEELYSQIQGVRFGLQSRIYSWGSSLTPRPFEFQLASDFQAGRLPEKFF